MGPFGITGNKKKKKTISGMVEAQRQNAVTFRHGKENKAKV